MGLVLTTDPYAAVDILARGDLCALPTETVYGLGALARSESAVAQVYAAKNRPADHPLIVHVGSLRELSHWIVELPDWAMSLAQSCWPGPLTLVGKRTALALDCVTGGQDTVAVRIPDHPLTLEVLQALDARGIGGVVAPSANRFGHVSPTTAAHVQADLGEYLSMHSGGILDGGPCEIGVESTIVLATGDAPVVLRPGGVSRKRIEEVTGLTVRKTQSSPRVSGSLESHYSPDAVVHLVSDDELGTLKGAIDMHRLAAPQTIDEFAAQLYASLRKGDELGCSTIYVVQPDDEGLAEAIRDRLKRAAH